MFQAVLCALSAHTTAEFVTVVFQDDLRLIFTTILYCMEQSPSWEANWFSASQEIPRILWNPKVHYRVCKIQLTFPIPSQINLVHILQPTSWISIFILSSHLSLDLPNGLFLSGFPAKTLYAPLLSPIMAYICNAENIVQEDETVPPFPDERFWPPSHVGVCKYFELVLVARQSHFGQFPMQSHKGDMC